MGISRYFHTLRYLKWTQIRYRILYLVQGRLRKSIPLKPVNTPSVFPASRSLLFIKSISAATFHKAPLQFCFLNVEHQFSDQINWNFSAHGKLWTYNLNYFEFLAQPDLPKTTGLDLIHHFIDQESQLRDGMEPFPISLRVLFWIRFLTVHQIQEERIDQSLYWQLTLLKKRLEYHLMGNHLLENGFALLMGSSYFADKKLFQLAESLLREQLEEQILPDGAHFERSPMYHQLMLYRLLDVINVLKHNPFSASDRLLPFLQQKAERMLSWLRQMVFSNGTLPRVNDSTPGIAPSPAELFEYAARLGLEIPDLSLGESGYRKYKTNCFELLIDVGPIGPDYIPGHAHSDTFNFVLHHRDQALIVDTGISTYEKNTRRNLERSTAAHNTVMVAGKEQSEVWGGFRVAKRARIASLTISNGQVVATHDGYRSLGVFHQRSFSWKTDQIEIHDQLSGDQIAVASLHFHPQVRIQLRGREILGDFGTILFSASLTVSMQNYDYALGFNQLVKAQKVVVVFKHELTTKIQLL